MNKKIMIIAVALFFAPFLKSMEGLNQPLIIRNSGNFCATINVVQSNGKIETIYTVTKPIAPLSDIYVQRQYTHIASQSESSQDNEGKSSSLLNDNNLQIDRAQEVLPNQELYQNQSLQCSGQVVKDVCNDRPLHQDNFDMKKIEKKLTWKPYTLIVGLPLAVLGIWYCFSSLKKILF